MVIEGLQKVIKAKMKRIEQLEETLSVPRMHFRYIERLSADEIVKQKDIILKEKSELMGIPVEELMDRMYANMASKEARKQVDELLNEEKESGGQSNQQVTSQAAQSSKELGNKVVLGPSASEANPLGRAKQDFVRGKLQKNVSNKTLVSRPTAESLMINTLMNSRFKFGL